MYLHRNTYVLLEAIVRAIQFVEPLVPLRSYARECVRDLSRKLEDVRSPDRVEWGVITDAAGNPVASIAVSELQPCQVEQLEDMIRAVIDGW